MLRLHRAAEAEMFAAARRYDEERPGLGKEFLDLLQGTLEDIAASPSRWPLVDERHRRRVVRRFPFSIYYRVIGAHVTVIAVAHHKRRPGYWSAR